MELETVLTGRMIGYFGADARRIHHALKVAGFARTIADEEGIPDGVRPVLLAAALLHDIGIHEAERKHQSTAARFQELEGPPIARSILEKLHAKTELIDEVCDIVGHHHHPREVETPNFQAVYDADLIANIEDNRKESPIAAERIESIIEKSFLTDAGRTVARDVLLP